MIGNRVWVAVAVKVKRTRKGDSGRVIVIVGEGSVIEEKDNKKKQR
jgi:hypothetical protein